MIALTDAHLDHWRQHGYVVLRDALGPLADEIQAWTEDLARWPETPGKWMKWFEKTDTDARLLCRVEDFVPYHPKLAGFLNSEAVLQVLSALMGEPAVLYKEKINFKLPGGAGYGAHQDTPAFGTFGHTVHITMMVPVDDAHPDNGCLEMVRDHPRGTMLAQAEDGTIDPTVANALSWTPLPARRGDLVFFDSFVPHRSAANQSPRPRRALYVTYNKAAEGDYRNAYFRQKRTAFPPECERQPGVDYSAAAAVFNLGNPIK